LSGAGFAVAFGQRKVPIGQPAVEQEPANQTQAGQAPPDAPQPEHQQGKVLPDEVWQGKTGDMLRMLGMSPNDPSNLVPDANSVNARLDRDRAKFEARLAEMNRTVAERVPGGQMRGFSLLPDPCWNGEMGQLLMMRLELFPYDDWNMIFLPADAATAAAFDMPLHPNGNVPAFVSNAERFLREADTRLRAAHDEAARTQNFGQFSDDLEEIRDKVKGLARAFLSELDKAGQERNG
jgi:hypothetical protein